MNNIKVLSVFGTRPEANKMAPVIKELEKYVEIESVVCVTAQHRHLLDQMLDSFAITPDYDLNIMTDRQTLTDVTVRALKGLEGVINEVRPDLLLVHGDPTTSVAAALAAFYAQVKVGHVEAGLRTYDKLQPYPEEVNRMLTGSLAELHFAPTGAARDNLLKENIPSGKIFVTGNTALDCMGFTVRDNYVFSTGLLNKIDFANRRVITMTAHRRENLGAPHKNIFRAVKRLAEDFPDAEIVYPVHPNPAVMEPAHAILGGVERVHLIDPLDVLDMHNLMNRSHLILTDSGGLQEEGAALKKPVIVLRNVTERPEGVATGALTLAGTDENKIYNIAAELMTNRNRYDIMSRSVNPFGDGKASERIVRAILYSFGLAESRPEDFSYEV